LVQASDPIRTSGRVAFRILDVREGVLVVERE
jgi:hypothetical protein